MGTVGNRFSSFSGTGFLGFLTSWSYGAGIFLYEASSNSSTDYILSLVDGGTGEATPPKDDS